MISNSSFLTQMIIWLSLAAAIALQIQTDILESPTYAGLRINLADAMLPAAGLSILASLLLKHSRWPAFILPRAPAWFGGLTAVLLTALITGYFAQGQIPFWGLYNKFLGWLVLLSLLLWGAWFARNAPPEILLRFMRLFCGFACVTAAAGAIALTLYYADLMPQSFLTYPLSGFMANRNSFAFLMICAAAMIFIFSARGRPLFPSIGVSAFWFIFPLVLIYIGSRAVWILSALTILAFLVFDARYTFKKILPFIASGLILIAIFNAAIPNFIFLEGQNQRIEAIPELLANFQDLNTEERLELLNSVKRSDSLRLLIGDLAMDLWKESPLMGAGLGSVQAAQPERFGQFLDVIDCSALWLLSETGLLGLSVFLGFYIAAIISLARHAKSGHDLYATMRMTMIGILLLFGLMSLLHEILYTRFLWFLLGMALALPAVSEAEKAPDRV